MADSCHPAAHGDPDWMIHRADTECPLSASLKMR